MDEELKSLLTIPQAAKTIGISRRTLDDWVRRGKVPSVDIAGRRLVKPGAITNLEKPIPRGNYPRVRVQK